MSRARLIALLSAVPPGGLSAHDDVGSTIQVLDKKIAATATADLHYQRAAEYRAIRHLAEAEADLRKALALHPDHREARVALIQLLGGAPEALTLAQTYLEKARTPGEKLEARYLIARVAEQSDDRASALATCAEIQKHHPDHPAEIDLLHAHLLLQDGRSGDAADILKAAHQIHRSIVLRNTWIDAALAAGRTDETLPFIEEELTDSRFRASWLIRRARARFTQKEPEKAKADLEAALVELNARIQPDRPDLTLIADRGLALALLGDKDLARRDLTTLQKSSLAPATYLFLAVEMR